MQNHHGIAPIVPYNCEIGVKMMIKAPHICTINVNLHGKIVKKGGDSCYKCRFGVKNSEMHP